jgi:isopenicillin-N N-acyltransferase like protein
MKNKSSFDADLLVKLWIAIAAMLVFIAVPGLSSGTVATVADSERTPRVIQLSGSSLERGLQEGKQLRTEITRIVGLWKKDLQKAAKMDADAFIKKFLAETSFTPAMKKWTPGLLEEIKGIAEGSGQTYETMLAYQMVDEIWVYLDKTAAHHCSGLGVIRTASHPAIIAQNMDLESFRDGGQVVLHIAESATNPEQFIFTAAGLIATNGMNNRSIAVTVNALMQLSASTDGLPVACIVRGVLAQTRGDEALRFLKSVKHASGQNYIVGVGDRVYDFEASANKVVEFRLIPDGNLVYHTNHPLTNDNLKPWHAKAMQTMTPEEKKKDNSLVRLDSLKTHLNRPVSAIDEHVVKETLQSRDSKEHPICRHVADGNDWFTFGSTIMNLSDRPFFQVTMGPPDSNQYFRLEFKSLQRK